jgi:atlastin
MWSEPFIRTTSAAGGEKLAVLLMDTQGMFDNETTMTLTAQIFGLSTLVSSFQVRPCRVWPGVVCSVLLNMCLGE